MKPRHFLFGLLVCFSTLISYSAAHVKDGVVIIVAEFPDRTSHIGTGFFVDHDGLIVTADHIIRRYKSGVVISNTQPGPAVDASKLTIYCFKPKKTFVIVPAKVPSAIVNGRIDSRRWIDIALIRIPLDPTTRLQIDPLDLSTETPPDPSVVNPYGASCNSPENKQCLSVSSNTTSISNTPLGASAYVVNTILDEGYSGGPLVDQGHRVVGICSNGVKIPFTSGPTTTATFRASYVPALFVLNFFLNRLPPSSFFSDAAACQNTRPLTSLTLLDCYQLSMKWLKPSAMTFSDPQQCQCWCESITKTPNAIIPFTGFDHSACAPPFCSEQAFNAALRTIEIVRGDPEVAVETVKAVADSLTHIYEALIRYDVSSNSVPALKRHQRYGDALKSLALNQREVQGRIITYVNSGGFLLELSSAALAAYMKSQTIEPTPDVYGSMAVIYDILGESKLSVAASLLKVYQTNKQNNAGTIDASFKELNIDPAQLKAVLAEGTKNLGSFSADQSKPNIH